MSISFLGFDGFKVFDIVKVLSPFSENGFLLILHCCGTVLLLLLLMGCGEN